MLPFAPLRRMAFAPLAALSLVSAFAACPTRAAADDNLFPPAPSAKPFMDFDGRGFLVGGQRTFLASAGLEYARIPRALWRDRLLRIKRGGFNTVEIYVFWNFHEPQEGKWNFAGDHDLGAFLDTVKEVGLYATVRVGPYVCAEWDSGGYPVWLRFKPNLAVRQPNAPFEAAVDKYFDKVIPIVAARQINRGGAVILVQLENEHPQGWGTDMPNSYFTHLRDKAVSLGLEVPYFFSGLHHGSDPAGTKPWDSAGRTSPWFTTEFWCDWYNKYGNPAPADMRREVRATWKIIAYGGNGYNYYMTHGGTNFDHFNNNEDASSYDYGAAIGQSGDLRPVYYSFKRAALFAQSLAPLLENSSNTTAANSKAATNPAVALTARGGLSGEALFLDNNTGAPLETKVDFGGGKVLPTGGPLRLEPGEIVPVVRDFPLDNGIILSRVAARILGIVRQGDLVTVVVYGQVGTPWEMHFRGAKYGSGVTNGNFEDRVGESRVSFGKPEVRVLAVSDTMADQTFFVTAGGQNYIVCGLPYVGEATVRGGQLHLTGETATANPAPTPPVVYGPAGKTTALLVAPPGPAQVVVPPTLGAWETRSAADEAAPAFNDAAWQHSPSPLQMGADGDDGAYAWYRTTIRAPQAGKYVLAAPAARDHNHVFVDGNPVAGDWSGDNATLPLALTAGSHTVAVFSASYGRDKLFNVLGPISDSDRKGLTGPVALRQREGEGATITGWRYQLTAAPNRRRPVAPPSPDSAGWLAATMGADIFAAKPGWAWYQATLPALPVNKNGVLHFAGVDDNATVYLNGVQVGQHQGWQGAFEVPVKAAAPGQPQILSVLVQNTANTGGITGPVTLDSYTYDAPVTGWRLRGGTLDSQVVRAWKPLAAFPAPPGSPRLFRTTFEGGTPTATTELVWRVTTTGLSGGFVYLNGHNLGRYPERIPVDGLYLPPCWLNSGRNTLVILDENGNAPTSVRITQETAASRLVQEWAVPRQTAGR